VFFSLQQVQGLKDDIQTLNEKFDTLEGKLAENEKARLDDTSFLREQLPKFAKKHDVEQVKIEVESRAKTAVVDDLMVRLYIGLRTEIPLVLKMNFHCYHRKTWPNGPVNRSWSRRYKQPLPRVKPWLLSWTRK
jgi:hypothetical protein